MGIETIVASAITAFFTSVGLGGVAFGTVTFAQIATAVILTAASIGLSYLMMSMQSKPKASDQQQSVKQSIPERQRTYGRDKVGGALFWYDVADGALYTGIVHGEGPIDAIEENWLNDKQGAADISAGSGLDPWAASVRAENKLGAVGQSASSFLLSAFPGAWSSAHRLDGLAYSVVVCFPVKEKFMAKVYGGGPPQLRVVMRGAKVYDPRSATTAWSDNPALCIRDYLIHSRGMRIASSRIDDASFSAFADVCDESVALAAGGTEKRYRLSHTYKLTAEPKVVLADLLRSCDAEIYPTADGKVGIRGGEWQAPTVEINDDDVISYQNFRTANGINAGFNRLKITFKDPLNDYQPVEVTPWDDAASQALVGVMQQDMPLTMVPSFTQARRLAKIFMARANPPQQLGVTVRYSAAIRMWGERMVSVTISELGMEDVPMFIGKHTLDPIEMKGQFELYSLAEDVYDWTTSEEGPAPTVAVGSGSSSTAPTPTGEDAEVEWQTASNGVRVGRIAVSVDPLSSDVYETVGQYRVSGATDWIDMTEEGEWRVVSGTVSDGETYEVRVAHSLGGGSGSGTLSAWVDLADVTVTADPTAPAAASQGDFAAVAGGSTITLGWTVANIGNVAYTKVYRATSSSFGAASEIATVYGSPNVYVQHADTPGSGTFYYWIKAFNGSGIGSTPEGPESGTV